MGRIMAGLESDAPWIAPVVSETRHSLRPKGTAEKRDKARFRCSRVNVDVWFGGDIGSRREKVHLAS